MYWDEMGCCVLCCDMMGGCDEVPCRRAAELSRAVGDSKAAPPSHAVTRPYNTCHLGAPPHSYALLFPTGTNPLPYYRYLYLLPSYTAMEAAIKIFFSSAHFAVVGASTDPSKFGHKGIPLLSLLSASSPFSLLSPPPLPTANLP